MIHYSDLLKPGTVLAGVTVTNKKALLNLVATVAAQTHDLDARAIVGTLTERERIGSTGFGNGIAIPHGRLDGLDRIVGLFVHLQHPIDFQAIDELPVDLVFMMLSPIGAGAEHLKALANVSRRLRDPVFVAKLRGAGSPDALYALWTGDESRDPA
ncbi:MAG: PTS lactose transporter subunit IIC [Sphingobium sp.]|nr:PTS lactose transporter subunit IIC [Sphingobium sp.]